MATPETENTPGDVPGALISSLATRLGQSLPEPDRERPLTPQNDLPITDPDTPYMHTRGLKPHTEWGKPDYILQGARRFPGLSPGPWMPQEHHAHELVNRNASFFTRHGSVVSGLLAGQMMLYRNKFYEDERKGLRDQARDSYERYKIAQEKLIRNNAQEFRLLADAFTVHKNNPAALNKALTDLSYQFDDPNLRHVLQTEGIQRVQELISERHNNDQDQLKLINQRLQAEKLELAQQQEEDLERGLRQLTDNNAQTDAVQNYIKTGEPELGAIPNNSVRNRTTPPTAGAGNSVSLPSTTPATHADLHAANQPDAPQFPAGITMQNAGKNRAQLTDWANQVGVSVPPPDAAGLNNWLGANAPSGYFDTAPAVPPAGAKPAAPVAPTAPQEKIDISGARPDTGVSQRAQEVAGLVGRTPKEMDRLGWDYLFYNRMPPETVGAPANMRGREALLKRAIQEVAIGRHGIQDTIEAIVSGTDQPPPNMTEKQSLARADKILDRVAIYNSEIANQVRAIVHGDVQYPTAGLGATARGPQMLRGLVFKVDPTYDAQRYVGNLRTKQAFTGTGVFAQRIQAFNTAINHITEIEHLIDSVPNGQSMDYNTFINNLRTRFGDTAVNNYRVAMNFVGTEVAKAFRGGQTTLSEINHVQNLFGPNLSPQQMRGGFRVMMELMYGQLRSLAGTYNAGRNKNIAPEDLLTDEQSVREMQRIRSLPRSGIVGLKDLDYYRTLGESKISEQAGALPPEALALQKWLLANPDHPNAQNLRIELGKRGWGL